MQGSIKLAVGALMVSAMFVATATFAQDTDKIEIARGVVEAERKMVISKAMALTETESEAFWPVYNEYREAARKVNDKRVSLIKELNRDFETLSGDRAMEMTREYLNFQESKVKLRKKFLSKFDKALPAKKTVRYYQLENRIDMVLDLSLARNIPLVD